MFSSLVARLRGLVRRNKVEAEVDDELRFHLEMEIQANVARGMTPSEARRVALRDLGGVTQTKEAVRGVRSTIFDSIWQDMRYALRRFRREPVIAAAAVLTLAVSIGAAAATWSLLSAVLMRPLPVAAPDRLVVVGQRIERGRDAGGLRNSHIYPLYPQIRDSGIFEGVAAGGLLSFLVGAGERPVQTPVYFASHDYFTVLGVRVPLGRGFTRDDDRRGAPLVVIMSDRYWRRAFDADAAVLGRILTIAGKPATVIGVVARGFRGLNLAQAPDLYMPLHSVADVGDPGMNYFAEPISIVRSSPTAWMTIVGRLRPGMSAEQAAARLGALLLGPGRPSGFGLTPVNTAAIPEAARAGMARFSRLLAITVGLLLLIGCATVGMLLLIRTDARREEFAMCLALGASRARLARSVVIEGGLLAIAGAACALPIAWWLFAGVRTFELPGGVAIELLELSLDARTVTTAAACAVAALLVISIVAGRFGFAGEIAGALRRRGGATLPATNRRTRAVLAAGQVAVAMVLLAGAGLFARSVIAALSVNPGFETTRIATGSLSLGPYGYTPARAAAFFDDLRDRLSRNPAIRSVSLTMSEGGMTSAGRLVIDGEPRQFPSTVFFTAIDQHYFDTVGVRVTKGRDFTGQDREGTARVTIVSESFGRMLSGRGSPLGHRITMPWGRPGQPPEVREVVGVVPDLITSVSTLEPLVMYSPIAQRRPGSYCTLVLRAATSADAARREAMSAIRQLDASVTPTPMLTIDERLAAQMAPQRFGALVMGTLGFIATLLTILGAYVLAESMAVLRRREMGIRASLGARGSQLGGLVLAETGRLVGLGLVIGLGLACIGANTIRAFLFRTEPLDPATLGGVAALILVLTMVVSLRPALRAARVDLAQVLREE
jgi:predicted permease